ncbi:type IX secretion system membrane protein PorP/SprF [Salmonirosea aquatica]|uniref:type IX secretion system membrane protein PorP/SprF n=1 Tax=Salmonirosea aquatica TaxID=2654236 RepID=UPI0035712E06
MTIETLFFGGLAGPEREFLGWCLGAFTHGRFLILCYPVGGKAAGKLVPHYYLTAAYRLELAEEWVMFQQLWFKKAGPASPSLDAQVRLQYADRVWGGLQYRHKDSLGGVLGMALTSDLTLSYAYEYPLSSISSVSTGSHEVLLGFRFNNRAAVYCPPMGW